jgi:hypothetical protein
MRRVALAAALLLTLVACREDFFDPTPGDTPGGEPRLELLAQNLRMIPGEPNAIRIALQAKDGSVHIRVERSDSSGRVIACPLRTIDDAVPATGCLPDLPNGVREGLTITGLGAVVLVREGEPLRLDITVDYAESGRRIMFRIPTIEPPAGASACKDNGCNPFFEVKPVKGGRFTASARWSGGAGHLEMLEGRVRARAFTSTGIPYRVAGEADGASPLSVAANLNAPSEYALALRNTSNVALTEIEIEMVWP